LSVSSGVVANSSNLLVQTPPSLSLTAMVLSPAGVSVGQQATLLITVSNNGQASAINVAPTNVQHGGTTNPPSLVSGPLPVTATVLGLSSQTFTYVYTASAGPAGANPWTLNFVADASGL